MMDVTGLMWSLGHDNRIVLQVGPHAEAELDPNAGVPPP